jgi:hypothetical protein
MLREDREIALCHVSPPLLEQNKQEERQRDRYERCQYNHRIVPVNPGVYACFLDSATTLTSFET